MLFHIVPRATWDAETADGGPYRGEAFDREGFVHLSTREQTLRTAAKFFAGQTGLVLVALDPARLTAEVRYEDLLGEGQTFPHLYGPLNLDAVLAVHPFEPDADGRFQLPPGV
jgi:uncharacterized protein (DUF952 family)